MPRLPATKTLLSLLAATGQTVVDFSTLLYGLKYHRATYVRGGHALVKECQRFKKEHVARMVLQQLKRANYVKAQKIGNRLMVSLTTKGRAASLAGRLKAAARGDKLATVVIFDIPESQNAARRQLRLLLRQGGFIKLQQSVWVSQADTYPLMAEFVRHVKLKRWVNVFRAQDFLNKP